MRAASSCLPDAHVVDVEEGGPVLAVERVVAAVPPGEGLRSESEPHCLWSAEALPRRQVVHQPRTELRRCGEGSINTPSHVPMAVFITSDMGSCGSWRGGVRRHSLRLWPSSVTPGLSAQISYSPNAEESMPQMNSPS